MKTENKFSKFLLNYRNLGEQEMLWEHELTRMPVFPQLCEVYSVSLL